VAGRAGGRESGLDVIRIRRPVEILDVARSAVGGRAHELSIDVAQIAGHVYVRAGERERRLAVVKIRGRPCRGRMAGRAGRRESRLRVIGIRRAVEILDVARSAIGGCAHELVVDVALIAGNRHVLARQRE